VVSKNGDLTDMLFLFFFSSRRRHTRFSRDWSSDVCSSDLGPPRPHPRRRLPPRGTRDGRWHHLSSSNNPLTSSKAELPPSEPARSEERRVGKGRISGRMVDSYTDTINNETEARSIYERQSE